MRDNLTQQEAEARARRVSNVDYTLALELTAGAATYLGELSATFDDTGGDAPLFIDFTGAKLLAVVLNGRDVPSPEWNGHRLVLPPTFLSARNRLVVQYENAYSHTGSGFHQFKDPEDGREYVFSDFEPYNAHQLFPCFDQPDLKASYTLSVTAPTGWQVVGNGRQVGRTPAEGGRERRHFEKTARFSTYIMAVIAGDFAVFEDTTEGRAGPIPLRVMCRKALAKHLDADEVLTITKQGFSFYEELFDYPYPFGKYDQVFVPEFNAGAMENTAAVTHGEHMIFRGQVSETQRLSRAETVLHELAHMWFGDLATMRWWDDLWLNESFATFISYLCMVRATRFTNAWEAFHTKIKAWAMKQDELVTTHPIAGRVGDTDATFLNFDGITYGKGASALKQLLHFLGEDGFRDGLRRYFKRHAYGNATLKDFLAALEEGSGRDLGEWSRLWIETKGLGSLRAEVDAKGGRVQSLAIVQEPSPADGTLRPHKTDVALFVEDERGRAVPKHVTTVLAHGTHTVVPELAGLPAPVFVAVNHGDHAYAKVVLDEGSLAYVREKLERIDDPLVKATLWGTLWQMVRDQKLPAQDYVALVASKVQHETTPEIVETLIANAAAAIGRYLGPALGETGALADAQARARAALVGRGWERLAGTKGDVRLAWLRGLLQVAREADDLDRLVRLMDGTEKLEGVLIDQDMRWTLIARLVAFARPGAEDRLAQELVKDPSDKGKKSAFRAEASRPSAEEKARVWKLFVEEGALSSDFLKNGMSHFHWAHQAELTDSYVARFFDEVTGVFEKRSPEFSKAFALLLYPAGRAEPAVLARGEALLGKTTHPVLTRLLLELGDELSRSIRCREAARRAAK